MAENNVEIGPIFLISDLFGSVERASLAYFSTSSLFGLWHHTNAAHTRKWQQKPILLLIRQQWHLEMQIVAASDRPPVTYRLDGALQERGKGTIMNPIDPPGSSSSSS
jgi:hypothetical protein